MRLTVAMAFLLSNVSLSLAAGELSEGAKRLLYCSAAKAIPSGQAEPGNDVVMNAIARVKSQTSRLLASEGFGDEVIELLAITSVEQVLDEAKNKRPRYYSERQCEEVSIKQ